MRTGSVDGGNIFSLKPIHGKAVTNSMVVICESTLLFGII